MLFTASSNGHADVVSFLIERGANVDLCGMDGMTPLFAAVQEGHSNVVEELLAHGANANLATSNNGLTPLYIASDEGLTDIGRDAAQQGSC
jgi:ankyrin repeat protein